MVEVRKLASQDPAVRFSLMFRSFFFISSCYSALVVVLDTFISQAVITAIVYGTDLIQHLYQSITKLHQNMSGQVLGNNIIK